MCCETEAKEKVILTENISFFFTSLWKMIDVHRNENGAFDRRRKNRNKIGFTFPALFDRLDFSQRKLTFYMTKSNFIAYLENINRQKLQSFQQIWICFRITYLFIALRHFDCTNRQFIVHFLNKPKEKIQTKKSIIFWLCKNRKIKTKTYLFSIRSYRVIIAIKSSTEAMNIISDFA